jgi:uncharacterized protein YndB with AHSA1/START domain
MKYTCEIEINRPVSKVVELFDDPGNMSEWMPGLLSFDPISGKPGQPGARSKLRFRMGKREIEMVETVTVRKLPEEFSGTYDAPGVHNIVKNSFYSTADGGTRWVTHNEFQFTSLMMKLMGLFAPGSFKKESLKHLEAFKRFAESAEEVSSEEEE